MNYSLSVTNEYKINTIMMSYRTAAEVYGFCPPIEEIQKEIINHFPQEFSLEVLIHDRLESFGATSEEHFLDMMRDGRFDEMAPTISETTYLLDALQMSFLNEQHAAANSVLQEVW